MVMVKASFLVVVFSMGVLAPAIAQNGQNRKPRKKLKELLMKADSLRLQLRQSADRGRMLQWGDSLLMAEYIKYLYKTARKFWAMVGVVTQELQDIIGSPIVKEAIINNSDVTMLLDQGKFKERFGEIQQVLGLTDVECRKIFTINRLENKEGRAFFREVFIRRGLQSDVYGVEEPHECYMTYTTERAEKEALKLYKKELQCNHQQAIEAYCRDWELSGISKSLAFAQKVNQTGHVLNLKNKKQ